jgi:hypothetical protein
MDRDKASLTRREFMKGAGGAALGIAAGLRRLPAQPHVLCSSATKRSFWKTER